MKPKDVVADLEYCKLIKHHFPKGTVFWWAESSIKGGISPEVVLQKDVIGSNYDYSQPFTNYFPAPTTEEILRVLPESLSLYELSIRQMGGKFSVSYFNGKATVGYFLTKQHNSDVQKDYNLANALAKMLIWVDKESP